MTSTTTNQEKRTIKLGASGPEVFPVGLGCMGMSGMYGATDDAESVRTIEAAIERGITLFDTGDFYGMGHNELLLREALRGRRDKVVLSVKFGALRAPDGSWTGVDGRPEATKNFAAYSLRRLGVEVIDVYRPARLDPRVPIEDTIGAIADLVKSGHVKHAGLSEVGAETVRRAQAVMPIADLQIEHSIASRGAESTIFPTLEALGVGATLYGVFSRGLLTGRAPTGPSDFRAYLPRFTGDHRAKNEEPVAAFARFAKASGRTPAQLALAWSRAARPGFVPVIGVKTRAQLEDALGALEKPLDASELAELARIFPRDAVHGERYAPQHMANLDSERGA